MLYSARQTNKLNEPRVFYTHKAGETNKDYQDACAYNLHLKRFAIADGSTGSFMSAIWSKLLVDRFCNDKDPVNLELFHNSRWLDWLLPVQHKWQTAVSDIIKQADPIKQWFIVNRFVEREPAIATFVVLEFIENKELFMDWNAIIIGDSCLFHIHQKQVNVFPQLKPKDFGYHPDFFASIKVENLEYKPLLLQGRFDPDDSIVLATDALAKWMLMYAEQYGWIKTIQYLTRIQTYDDFYKLVNTMRAYKTIPLENDDVTLMIINSKLYSESDDRPTHEFD